MELVKEQPSSKELGPGRASLTTGDGTVLFEGTHEEFCNAGTAMAHKLADKLTGELPPLSVVQPTLDPTIFPAVNRRLVPMVKVVLTGSKEMTMESFEAYCDQGLEPGRIVKLTMTGYLPEPHPKYVKRTETIDGEKAVYWELEGQIKVKILELGSFELGGIYDGE